MTELILQHGRAAAVVGPSGVYLSPHIVALPTAHPVRRHVTAKAIYALEVVEGSRPGPYSDREAERWARALLRSTCIPGRRRGTRVSCDVQ